MRSFSILAALPLLAIAANVPLESARRLATCTDSCGTNNGASSVLGACKNGSQCTLTSDNCIYCTGCPAGYSGYRCEVAPAGGSGTGVCANNGAADPLGPCRNGSTCTTNAAGQIWCQNCPAGYTGYRCEIPPAGATSSPTKIAGQVCGTNNGADSTGGACQNGSKCTITNEGYVYCTGCPAGYSGYRCEVAPAGPTSAPTKIAGQVCGTNNGADSDGGACQNGSTCTLTNEGYVYCTGCPAGYTGYRCEKPPNSTPCGLGDRWNVAYCTADQVCLEQCGKACGYSCQPKTAPGCNPLCDPATQVCEYGAYSGVYQCKTKPIAP